jgi:hypothetical protein
MIVGTDARRVWARMTVVQSIEIQSPAFEAGARCA